MMTIERSGSILTFLILHCCLCSVICVHNEKRLLQIQNQLEPEQSIKKLEWDTETVDPKTRATEAHSTPHNANQVPSLGAKVSDNSSTCVVGSFRALPPATAVTSAEPVKSLSKPSTSPVGGRQKADYAP